MTRRLSGIALPLTGLLLFGLMAGTTPVSALYIETPLLLNASDREVDVGDTVSFTLDPRNATEAARWAGQTVLVRYAFDENETPEGAGSPDDSTSSSSYVERVLLAELTLDEGGEARFEWTVPEEVRDHNVDVKVVSADEEDLAFDHLAVGDAPPQMRLMAGSGPAEPDQGAQEPDTESQPDDARDPSDAARNTPAVGLVAALGTVATLAAVFARRP